MSELQLKPEFENVPAGETLRGVASSGAGAAAADAASSGSHGRGGRRRSDATRLRLSTDDGFRLFRVY
jgi:hypothetical protein